MSQALSVLRRREVELPCDVSFASLGLVKYALASSAAVVVTAAIAVARLWWLAPLAVFAFYAVEVQMLFAFPLAIDRHPRPLRGSRRLMLRSSGTTARAVARVLPIATLMLFGGFFGRGFLRSWAIGCLAVCIWYEQARALRARPTPTRGFELGAARPPIVRCESCVLGRAGKSDGARVTSLLYVSDLHLTRPWTRRLVTDLPRIARETRPDAILLGGDLVDNVNGLADLARLVERLSRSAPLYARAGNHDERMGIARVRATVTRAGGQWLDATPVQLTPGLWMCGAVADASHVTDGARVLCAHDPADFPSAAEAGFDLVLAGHLHGGQCVWFERAGRQYPGAWLNRWTGLRFCDARRRCTMIVSRGAGDTLPLRWNCPREVVLCQIR